MAVLMQTRKRLRLRVCVCACVYTVTGNPWKRKLHPRYEHLQLRVRGGVCLSLGARAEMNTPLQNCSWLDHV